MLALRRVCSRRLVPTGVLSRTNTTTATPTPTETSVPPPPPPTKNEEKRLAGSAVPRKTPETLTNPKAGEKDVQEASTSTTPAKKSKPKTKGRKVRVAPQASQVRLLLRDPRKPPPTKTWTPALRPGVVPAYDEALKVIFKDSRLLKREAREFKQQVELKDKEAAEVTEEEQKQAIEEELEQMRKRLNILEVQSEVNLPNTRWLVSQGNADMRVASHRHLVEQQWRKDGKLDLLMERLHQMNIIPDVLPVIHPSVDLDVMVKPPLNRAFVQTRRVFLVEPGRYITPQQTIKPPTLYPQVYHTDTRLYTMLMIDPDVPDEDNQTFTSYLHWMQPNIPLSASRRGPILNLNNHTRYIPPHPQRGTPYHRYTILLLPNPPKTSYSLNVEAKSERGVPTSEHLDIHVVADSDRLGFNVREFVKKHNLNAALGGGYHMFRQVWDETVSGIYEVLGRPEPHYGVPVKEDPYAALKRTKKYV